MSLLKVRIKMLTIDHVIQLCEDGVGICFKRKPHPLGFKGEWDVSTLGIYIFVPHCNSLADRDITLIHEFIHARNDLIFDNENPDMDIENEALETYMQTQGVLDSIKELYSIK